MLHIWPLIATVWHSCWLTEQTQTTGINFKYSGCVWQHRTWEAKLRLIRAGELDSIVICGFRLTSVCLRCYVCVRLHCKAVFAIPVDSRTMNLTVCVLSSHCFVLCQTLWKNKKCRGVFTFRWAPLQLAGFNPLATSQKVFEPKTEEIKFTWEKTTHCCEEMSLWCCAMVEAQHMLAYFL